MMVCKLVAGGHPSTVSASVPTSPSVTLSTIFIYPLYLGKAGDNHPPRPTRSVYSETPGYLLSELSFFAVDFCSKKGKPKKV